VDGEAQTAETSWTIGRLLQWTTQYLDRHGVDESRLASEVLLSRALDCQRIDLYARHDAQPDPEALAQFRTWVQRAGRQEPVAYIVEEKEFFSLLFRVAPDVLIPRPESEVLVECAMDYLRQNGPPAANILDLGTGSGCLSIVMLHQDQQLTATATDVSPAALAIAEHNAEKQGVLDRLTLLEVDGLTLPGSIVPEGGYDLLISNPPYVAANEMESLASGVRDHEPSIALTDGHDGLSFYRMIAEHAPSILKPKAAVVIEVGDGQANEVRTIMEEGTNFIQQETRKDKVVGVERVLRFSRQ
jgi:release factor glutamine methyltransferase